MTSTLFLTDQPEDLVPHDEAPHIAALLARPIHFVETLDYAAMCDDDLEDLTLDRTSVLTAETEARLFTQMNFCYYRAAMLREGYRAEDPIDAEAVAEVSDYLARGDLIRNRILVIFHKLTVSIAKHFLSPRHSLDELVSEGDATLLRAIALFDVSRGYRFSTYATFAVRRRLGRYVTSAEHQHATPIDFREAAPIADERRWTLSYEREVLDGVAWLETALYEVSQRERYILRCRFGWGQEFEPRTLQEIADELGVSRERVRQLEARALLKLRRSAGKLEMAC